LEQKKHFTAKMNEINLAVSYVFYTFAAKFKYFVS